MKIEENSVLIVIDVQGGDMTGTWSENLQAAMEADRKMVENAKRVLDVFRAKKIPVIQLKEVHRKDMVDFGRELDGT